LALPGALNNAVGYKVSDNTLQTGIRTLRLQNGRTGTLLADSNGRILGLQDAAVASAPRTVKRVSWREIAD
jgi:hypothetical protein